MRIEKKKKFVGSSAGVYYCEMWQKNKPHHPHYLDIGYKTIRYGWVRYFCSGIEAPHEVFVEEGIRGCACSLSSKTITILVFYSEEERQEWLRDNNPIRTRSTHEGRCA